MMEKLINTESGQGTTIITSTLILGVLTLLKKTFINLQVNIQHSTFWCVMINIL